MKKYIDIFYFYNFGYFPGKSFCFLIESALASDLDIFIVFDLVFAGDIPASSESLFVGLLDLNIFIVSGLFVAPFDRSLPAANRIFLTGVCGNEG